MCIHSKSVHLTQYNFQIINLKSIEFLYIDSNCTWKYLNAEI